MLKAAPNAALVVTLVVTWGIVPYWMALMGLAVVAALVIIGLVRWLIRRYDVTWRAVALLAGTAGQMIAIVYLYSQGVLSIYWLFVSVVIAVGFLVWMAIAAFSETIGHALRGE